MTGSAPDSPASTTSSTRPPDLLDSAAAGPAAIRGGALRSIAYIVGTIAGVVSAALLFRHLGVVDTGRYTIAITLVAIVAGVSDLGLTAIGVRELSVTHGDARDAIARNLLGLRIALSIVGVAAIVLFSIIAGYGATLTLGVALAGVGLILQSVQSTLAVALTSDLRLVWVSVFELLRGVLAAALVIILVLAGASLLPFLAVTIPVGIFVLVLNVWVVHGHIPLRPAFHPGSWWAMVRDVLPYSAAVAAGTLYFYIALILVSLIANSEQVGYYGLSSRVIQILLVLPGLAVGAAFPIFSRAARDDRTRLAYAVGKVFEVSLIAGVLVSLCLAIGSSLVVEVVGGPKFAPAATVLAIQGIALGASFSGAVWSNGLLSVGRYRAILLINLFALVLGGILVAVMVDVDGARGAAIATSAAEVVLAGMSGWVLARTDPSLAPHPRIVVPLMIATGTAVATTLLPLPVIVSVCLAAGVYLAVLLALRALPLELMELMPLRRRH